MKVKDLINKLKGFDENLNVDLYSTKMESYSNIGEVSFDTWVTRDGKKHQSVTLKTAPYEEDDSYTSNLNKEVKSNSNKMWWENPEFLKVACTMFPYKDSINIEEEEESKEEEKEDREFVQDVNKNIIDEDEAIDAKKTYKDDETKIYSYDEIAKTASRILFGSDCGFLNDLSMEKLISFVTKNNWLDEVDKETLSDKVSLLKFLYHKLESKIEELCDKKLVSDIEELCNKGSKDNAYYGPGDGDIYDVLRWPLCHF
jgi:hypothetical protein